jgi:hypothetical protein
MSLSPSTPVYLTLLVVEGRLAAGSTKGDYSTLGTPNILAGAVKSFSNIASEK